MTRDWTRSISMSQDSDLLAPPRRDYVNPDHIVPLSPPSRPPFVRYHSSSSLPATPYTPYPPPPATGPSQERTRLLQPYLDLPPRLLLTTPTPAILPLILTIAHLIQTRSSTASLAATLRDSVLSACSGLAKGAASIQTMPRYLAIQTNDEVVRATQTSILSVGAALIDSVTIIETVVTFILDTYRSMLLCTIELAVRGTLDILIGAIELVSRVRFNLAENPFQISTSVTSSLNSVRSGIQNDIASANSVIQSAVGSINASLL